MVFNGVISFILLRPKILFSATTTVIDGCFFKNCKGSSPIIAAELFAVPTTTPEVSLL